MRPRRVLVVDDDYVVREELMRVLRAQDGLSAIGARDGEAARIALRSARVHLILLDLLLPDGSAGRLLARRAGDEALARIPVVGMTARGLPRPHDELVAPCTGLLAKPFGFDDLVATVRSVLE